MRNDAVTSRSTESRVAVYEDLEDLPESYRELFAAAGQDSFFQSWHWYSHLINTIGTDAQKARIYGLEEGGADPTPLAAMVMRNFDKGADNSRARTLKSYTNFYTYAFSPIQPADSELAAENVRALVAAICAERPRWDVLQFEAIRKPSPLYDLLNRELAAQGLLVRPYFQSGNWYQDVSNLSSEAYIAPKGRSVSQEVSRKERKLLREHDVRIELITEPDQLESAIPDYQKVYELSWKEPETYPDFIPELIRISANSGGLRLGMMYIGDEPVASQLTIISGQRGIMYKTAFVPQYGKASVGNIIMINVIRHLLDVDHIAELDFGQGDDTYKSHWLTDRRENWGVMAFNPRTLNGILGAVRHIYGPAIVKRFAPSKKTED